MAFPDYLARTAKELMPGVHARTFWEKNLMLALVDLAENAVVPFHNHPHEQAGVVLDGKVEFEIAGEIKVLGPGDLYMIPGGVEHRATALEGPAQVLDIFSPVREEYK
jgi:quercetin dioxygenase-like cupin family protein